ncbi:MAG TPA: hypothetical protein VFR75_01315 [Solirubrobacterales bacterium]|nr:hypothetical protein [Solirubrobacterales bacterium]
MKRAGSGLVLALILALALPLAARAAYDPIGGGVTRIVLDKRFTAFLRSAGVSVTAGEGAARRGRTLVLPVGGGNFDPAVGRGKVEQEGAIVFRSSRRRLPLRKLVVKTAGAPLVAKVGGSQLKVATAKATRSKRRGFGAALSAGELKLTEKVATRLNKKLRPRRQFGAGQVIGTLRTEAQPLLTSVVPTGRATVAFDSAFLAKLDQHFVSLNPISPAERLGATFTLPIIAEGALAPDASAGTLRTGGEIEFLQLGAGQVFWHELWFDVALRAVLAEVDVEPTPAFPGKLGQIPVLSLGAGAAASDPGARSISIVGAPLALAASTAATFNQAFAAGEEHFKPGELLGTFSFTARGQ